MSTTNLTPKTEGSLSKKELRLKYKVGATKFRKMLQAIGLTGREKLLLPFQIGMLFSKYGNP